MATGGSGAAPISSTPSRSAASRHVPRIDRSVPPPAHPEQPRPCVPDRQRLPRPRRRRRPSVEPARRRGGIQPTRHPGRVLSRVEEDVAEDVSHLPGRPQHAQVVALREHRPAPTEDAAHGPRQTRSERLHPAAERDSVVCLHDEMCVVRLQRVLHDAEVGPCATAPQRLLEGAHQTRRAHAERHVGRVRRGERRPAFVRHGRPRPPLPPCTRPRAAPATASRQREWELPNEAALHDT
jgi:hypothetical protein